MKYNFNGFTEKANEALNCAITAAEAFGHTYIGSEHLLLGLLRNGSGIAYGILNKNGITAEKIEDLIEETIGRGTPTKLSPAYFTPRAKKVLETAVSGAKRLGNNLVGTEHILIGVLNEGDNYAVRFINALSVDVASLSSEIMAAAGMGEQNFSKKSKDENKREKGRDTKSEVCRSERNTVGYFEEPKRQDRGHNKL